MFINKKTPGMSVWYLLAKRGETFPASIIRLADEWDITRENVVKYGNILFHKDVPASEIKVIKEANNELAGE